MVKCKRSQYRIKNENLVTERHKKVWMASNILWCKNFAQAINQTLEWSLQTFTSTNQKNIHKGRKCTWSVKMLQVEDMHTYSILSGHHSFSSNELTYHRCTHFWWCVAPGKRRIFIVYPRDMLVYCMYDHTIPRHYICLEYVLPNRIYLYT